jgi:D-alanine--poly(phosphoribitol) ligase subunit 1
MKDGRLRYDFQKNEMAGLESAGEETFIVGSDQSVSFKNAANLFTGLRDLILELKIPAGHPVCIYGEKEAVFPLAMIALQSLNIPYVPIDAIMPEGRIQNIREQTHSKVLINCSKKNGSDFGFNVVISGALLVRKSGNVDDYKIIGEKKDPVRYILFTSGSTGIPKGVQITASALKSFASWYLTWPMVDSGCVFMNQAPFSFDVSLCDLIGAFGNGCKLVLNDYETLKGGKIFLDRLSETKANTLVCTPAFIQMYLSVPDFNAEKFKELRQVVFMGEELLAANVRKLKRAFPSLRVVNAYGPTEATVVTTYIEITDEILRNFASGLPIGYSRPDGEINILEKDKDGIGEIGISGPHLSVGYLNDSEKTEKAFVNIRGKRIYKTGDLGVVKDDLVFYLGRNDSQVKLNGYRIELDEISNVLLNHPALSNAAVVPLMNGRVTKKIVAFIVAKEGERAPLDADLRIYLGNKLPSYMIPSEFIVKETLPLNANYKTDKKALVESYLFS